MNVSLHLPFVSNVVTLAMVLSYYAYGGLNLEVEGLDFEFEGTSHQLGSKVGVE